MKQKILFIDRDGTLIKEPPVTFQVTSFDQLEFLPGVIHYLGNIARSGRYRLVMVTNQDGLGTENYPESQFWPIQNLIIRILESQSIYFEEVHIDRSYPHENLPTRKPGMEMLKQYMNGAYDLKNSCVIGDRITDALLAKNLGCKSIFIRNYEDPNQSEVVIDTVVESWKQIYELLISPIRKAAEHQITNKTEVRATVTLGGSGQSSIHTGIVFFDQMLEQVARHGQMDLFIEVKSDLHTDEHPILEATGITFGKAFKAAMGNKQSMEQYGFLLPVNSCIAQVTVGFGGSSKIEWKVTFSQEKIGDMPTKTIFHFFRSFSDAAGCNLNIQAEGENEHHKAESIFRSFAKVCRMAVSNDPMYTELLTSKGIV